MPQAAVPLAGEAVLAGEVMATEAATALAAEQAAQIAAAEAAAQAAAQAAAEQAVTTAGTAGIEALGAAPATMPTGIEALNPAFEQGLLTPEQLSAYTNGLPTAGPSVQVADLRALSPETLSSYMPGPTLQAGTAPVPAEASRFYGTQSANFPQTSPDFVQSAMNAPVTQTTVPEVAELPYEPLTVSPRAPIRDFGVNRTAVDMGGAEGLQRGAQLGIKNPGLTPAQMEGASRYSFTEGLNYTSPLSASTQTPAVEPNAFDAALDYIKNNKMMSASMGLNALNLMNQKKPEEPKKYSGPLSKFKFNPSVYQPYEPRPPAPAYSAQYNTYAGGGPIEAMSNANALGENTGYPMADINKGAYATPYQTPISRNVVGGVSDTGVNPMTGEMQFASGGISSLGDYADYAGGGRMLKGPGDGMSDNIPATIAGKQPARLANEEFVIPADVVSHLGNGSSEAGAKALYRMMDRVRQARTGTKKQGKQINPEKYLA